MNRRHGSHVILGAITPAYDAIDADTLTYPNLRFALKHQSLPAFILRSGSELWQNRFKFSPAEFQEDWRSTYLLNAAYRLQKAWTAPEKMFWSAQFTTTSVKLFGRPLTREVSSIASHELKYFQTAVNELGIDVEFAEPVLNAYRSLLAPRSATIAPIEERYSYVLARIHEYFHVEFGDCFRIFDSYSPHLPMRPIDIADSFSFALNVLKAKDPAWNSWKVIFDNSSKLAVNVPRKAIVVGRRRASMSRNEARALFAHEVLVHALRAVEGAKHSPDLMFGLPHYLTAEEGFGVLVESALNHCVPHKVRDRYVDVALALGAWRRRPLTRSELYTFCYTRSVLRALACGEDIDLDKLEKTTWEHVNRIYRGSLGNRYVAVFTKDVAYYKGFIKIANYLNQAEKGGRFEAALSRLYRGKYDPTDPSHRKYIRTLSH